MLNDFEAVGYGILALEPKDVVALNDAKVKPQVRYVLKQLYVGPHVGTT